MCPPLFREFPPERERISWIDPARDHADQRFIVFRLRPWHFFDLQYLRSTVLVATAAFIIGSSPAPNAI